MARFPRPTRDRDSEAQRTRSTYQSPLPSRTALSEDSADEDSGTQSRDLVSRLRKSNRIERQGGQEPHSREKSSENNEQQYNPEHHQSERSDDSVDDDDRMDEKKPKTIGESDEEDETIIVLSTTLSSQSEDAHESVNTTDRESSIDSNPATTSRSRSTVSQSGRYKTPSEESSDRDVVLSEPENRLQDLVFVGGHHDFTQGCAAIRYDYSSFLRAQELRESALENQADSEYLVKRLEAVRDALDALGRSVAGALELTYQVES